MGHPWSQLTVLKDIKLLHDQGNLHNDDKNYILAQFYYNEALNKLQDLDAITFIKRQKWLCRIYQQMADTHYKLHQSTKAYSYIGQAFKIADGLDSGKLMITCLDMRGLINYSTGCYIQALNDFNDSLQLKLKQPSRYQQSDIAKAYVVIGNVHLGQYQYHDALIHFQQALKIYRRLYKDPHEVVAQVFNKMGIAYDGQSNYDDAVMMHQKALEIQMKLKDGNLLDMIHSYNYIGIIHQHQAQFEKALSMFRIALISGLNNGLLYHPIISELFDTKANVYMHQTKYEDALSMYKMALDIEEHIHKGNHANIAHLYCKIADIHCYLCDYKRAIDMYHQALTMRIALYGSNHLEVVRSYTDLKEVYLSQSQRSKALIMQEHILDIELVLHSENNCSVADCYRDMGILYMLLSRPDDAMMMYKKAFDIRLKLYGENHIAIADCHLNLGNAYAAQSHYHQALDHYNKAIGIFNQQSSETILIETVQYGHLAQVMKPPVCAEKLLASAVDCSRTIAKELRPKTETKHAIITSHQNIKALSQISRSK